MSEKNVQVSQTVARTLLHALYSFKRRMQERDEWCGRTLSAKVYEDIDAAFKELLPQTRTAARGSQESQ
jgi:N-glycosylase/DNA lyase